MFIIGHIGLTIAIIILGLIIFKRTDLLQKLDFRIIAVIAILPDIIDKTVGHIIFRDSLNNGRLFSHSLVFLVVFTILFYLVVRIYWWSMALPIATHQVFDILWNYEKSWYWPAFGWGFERLERDPWNRWIEALLNDPYIYSTEILGAAALIIIFVYFGLYKKDRFLSAMRTGRLVY
jgi:hypothetical protein